MHQSDRKTLNIRLFTKLDLTAGPLRFQIFCFVQFSASLCDYFCMCMFVLTYCQIFVCPMCFNRTCYMAGSKWRLWPTSGTKKFDKDRRALRTTKKKPNFSDRFHCFLFFFVRQFMDIVWAVVCVSLCENEHTFHFPHRNVWNVSSHSLSKTHI